MSICIHAQKLSKKFGNKTALNAISIEIETGSPIALVGPNGAGKTTFFSLICGFIQPTSGSLRLFGHAPSSPQLFGKLAALPQDALLDPNFTIASQLNFYGRLQGLTPQQSQYETDRVLTQVHLRDVANSKPNELSHGMKKRVSIAQTLIGSPELIMLDEATAGLDPNNAREIRQLINELSEQATFVLSSHDLSELERLCDRVLYLDQGNLHTHQLAGNKADTNSQQHYLTLQMRSASPDMEEKLKQLQGVEQVQNTQSNEFVLRFTPQNAANDLDIALLQLCKQQGWEYRALINGNTLENQLFK